MDKNFKEFAVSKGLKLSNGIAYGNLHSHAATLSDGDGFKQITITTRFADSAKQRELETYLRQNNIFQEYSLRDFSFFPERINIVFFYNNKNQLLTINNFINWFFPLLDQYSASDANTCPICGGSLTGGCWKLIGGAAYHLHRECSETVCQNIEASNADVGTGSYLGGFLGAIIGATLGGILWGLVLFIGYVASIIGFVIGWLAEMGYTLLHGKKGIVESIILGFAVIFGVLFGTIFSQSITLVKEGFEVGELPKLFSLLFQDSKYVMASLFDIILGLVFAALGAFSLIKGAGKKGSKTKVIDLE